jgi:LmbE family N-acetylglucosaminyl deacetylase
MSGERRRILGVFAHPDDEVFCAGGTLARYTAAGAEAMVLSATRGEAGQIRDAALATRRTLGQVREAELRQACACLGVEHVRCLDHTDGSLAGADRAALVGEIAGTIADFAPQVVLTFGFDGLYGHPDHIAISEATTAAVQQLAAPDLRLFHSHLPRSRMLLLDRIAHWLVEMRELGGGHLDFARAFSLFAQETAAMRFATDHIAVQWFPPGLGIVEQDEPADSLYLILSGTVEVRQEQADGSVRPLATRGPGDFFGELGVVGGRRRAHVVAVDSVTCMVFSPGEHTLYAGRGGVSELASTAAVAAADSERPATTVIDVADFIGQKIAAVAAHRTQYPIDPAMFPRPMLVEMMGREHFMRVHPPVEPETDLFAGMP